MRSDEGLGELRAGEVWQGRRPGVWHGSGDPMRSDDVLAGSVSFSGEERNKLFLNLGGLHFEDVSGLSGADSIADGRAVALFDYDRDGWQDLALVNTNKPLLEVFRNRIGDRGGRGRFIAVRLVGGNTRAAASDRWSNRDGVGAELRIDLGDMTLVRERRAGEGFAAQNSATLLVGIGERKGVRGLEVRWPSGRIQAVGEVSAGTELTLYENPEHATLRRRYAIAARGEPEPPAPDRLDLAGVAPLNLYVTTATWCPACKASLPQVRALRDAFQATELGILGLPIDPDDTQAKLARYRAEYAPAYRLVEGLSPGQIGRVEALVERRFGEAVLPASVATDNQGRVLAVWDEVPSLSEMRRVQRLMHSHPSHGSG